MITPFVSEALPFGKFQSKGDYVGASIKREPKPKLSIGLTYDINENAVRERAQLGGFIRNAEGDYFGKTLHTFFADLMYKHQGFSLMAEYAHKKTDDNISNVFDEENQLVGTFYTGSGLNVQVGYLCKKNWEIAARVTTIRPDEGVARDENQYTLGLSKYVVGHKLKVQTDLTYRSITSSDDELLFRTQLDIHF